MLNIGFANQNFRDRLKALYERSHIDITDVHCFSNVAKYMLDTGIYERTPVQGYLSTKDIEQIKKDDISKLGTQLKKHIKQSKYDDVQKVSTRYLRMYADFFKCSFDYLMGYISTPTHTTYDDVPLSNDAIENIRRIKENYIVDDLNDMLSEYLTGGLVNRIPQQRASTLNLLLASPHFYGVIDAFHNVLHSEFKYPVHFEDAEKNRGGWRADHNEGLNPDQNVLYLSDSIENAQKCSNNIGIIIDDAFLDSISFKQIEQCLRDIKSDYLKSQQKEVKKRRKNKASSNTAPPKDK